MALIAILQPCQEKWDIIAAEDPMTIRAIVQNGRIQPLGPLPANWGDGKELVVEDPSDSAVESGTTDWEKEMDLAAAKIPSEEHERFLKALEIGERESKEAVRREWGLS